MLAVFAAWTILEIVLVVAFLIAFAIATSLDRAGRESPKFWVAFIGLVAFVAYQYWMADNSRILTWDYWKTLDPYLMIGRYLCVGMVYAMFEALYDVVSRQRAIKFAWDLFLDATSPETRAYASGTQVEASLVYGCESAVRNFCASNNHPGSFLELTTFSRNPVRELRESRTPIPRINVSRLTDFMFSWAFFWPGYLLSLIFGRVLDNFWEWAMQFFGSLLQRLTNSLFRNTFKV